jgi:hypothetical protein
MKIILTEKQIKRLINEQFDQEIMDMILDKYNEVGLKGLEPNEIEYLKSGGESETPYYNQNTEPTYSNDIFKNSSYNDYGDDDDDTIDEDDILMHLSDLIDMMTIIDIIRNDAHFTLLIKYEKSIYDELINIFKTEKSSDVMFEANNKQTKIGIKLPNRWYQTLFGS